MLQITKATNGFIVEAKSIYPLSSAESYDNSAKTLCMTVDALLEEIKKFYTETAKG